LSYDCSTAWCASARCTAKTLVRVCCAIAPTESCAAKPAVLRRDRGIQGGKRLLCMEPEAQAGVVGSLFELRQVAEVLLRQAHVVDVVPPAAVSCNVPVAMKSSLWQSSQRPVLRLKPADTRGGGGGGAVQHDVPHAKLPGAYLLRQSHRHRGSDTSWSRRICRHHSHHSSLH